MRFEARLAIVASTVGQLLQYGQHCTITSELGESVVSDKPEELLWSQK